MLHVPNYSKCPDAEVVALCDVVKSKAQALAHRWAPDAVVYTDYKKMLKEAKLDAVSVCLPNYLHCPVSVDALNAKCHVMVEKPMACSSAEAQKMIDTAKKNKRLLNVNQTQRLSPVHIKAKEIIDSGIMGKILHVTAMFGHSGPESWSPTGKWFFKKKEARFGAMADLGVHKSDLIRFLTGKEVAEVSAFFGTVEKKNTDVEDNFVSCLKFNDGTMGTLGSSWTVKAMEANYTILHCTNGALRISEIPGQPLVASLVNPGCKINFDVPPIQSNDDESWAVDAGGAFIRAILGKDQLFCPGEEGKRSLDIILAAEKAAMTKRTVKLK